MRNPKLVFIAHPVSGDVEGNIKKILKICHAIHSEEVIPFAPYLVEHLYFDNSSEAVNLQAIANTFYFESKKVDELWLFGDHISNGMKNEVRMALKNKIPIFTKTPETEAELKTLDAST